MKIVSYFVSRFLTLAILLLGVLWGCQETLVEPDPDEFLEKSAVAEVVPMSGTLSSGALYEIVLPLPAWNVLPKKILLVYAHGYEDADFPVELPDDEIEGVPIKNFVVSKGMGYATTSFRENGLAVLEGIEDILLLRETIVNFFATNPSYLPPDAVVLVGPSEGGLITVLTIEQNPGLFDAALATCCPIGDFYKQMQYYGDAHVLFKYFFGPSLNDINLGSPKRISKATLAAWKDGSLPAAIIEVLSNDFLYNGGNKIRQFIACANIPVDMSDPERTIQVILEVIRYPIKATNDALDRLGGNPFNNKMPMREYTGSDNDRKLNLTVERIKRSDWETAAKNVSLWYETTGELYTPLITLHKLNDHITFYEHQTKFISKVNANSPFPGLLIHIPVPGECSHCTFQISDIEYALSFLTAMF
ncbi:hypothetical protein OU798_17775 [Prolixibacteraceae bacterium Z1-6]|uniref:Peptidase S9 prolyl oligopeptidase catalytic domain-containing protein n=1 Tax=Draconibacterium aestuarii TaxID=2998507 RepID=A0A9X3F813_9BACT|nr:hypothetical protein [Prolixibacteraceae bacterium Z1-6]